MAVRYATLAELKTWLGITGSSQDANLAIALEAAEVRIDDYCGRQFDLSSSAEARYFTADDPVVLFIDEIGNTTDLAIVSDHNNDGTYEYTWTENAVTGYGFLMEPQRAAATSRPWTWLEAIGTLTWPVGIARGVKITAKWGFPTVPVPIKQAALLQAERLWKRKDAPFGVAGTAETGFLSLRADVDPDVKHLLAGYRRTFAGAT